MKKAIADQNEREQLTVPVSTTMLQEYMEFLRFIIKVQAHCELEYSPT